MSAIEFVHTEWLLYVLVGVLVVLGTGIAWLRRRKRFVRFYGRRGGRIYGQFRASCFVFVLCLIALGLGLLLCEPYTMKETPHEVFEPLHVVIALDVSRSMLAPSTGDPCSPSRLDLAVREVRNFIGAIEEQGSDKAALVLFARYAYPAIPVPTDDYRLFERRLEKDTYIENILTMPEGTNHWYAVESAIPVFGDEEQYRKLLVILTDGEPDAPQRVLAYSRAKALRALSKTGIGIYLVGIGEPGIRQAVPVARLEDGCPEEERGYLVQTGGPDEGRIMTTVADPASLMALSRDLDAQYVHSTTGADLAEIMGEIVERERVKVGVDYMTAYVDLSEPLIGILLLLTAILVCLKTP